MKASVYMQGKRIKMFDIKACFGLWEERRGEARREAENIPTKNVCKAKEEKKEEEEDEQKKSCFSFQREEQEFESLNKEGVSRQHITVPLQSTIGTAGVAAIEHARADVCIGRYHHGAQTRS